jgi:hypothetical protein
MNPVRGNNDAVLAEDRSGRSEAGLSAQAGDSRAGRRHTLAARLESLLFARVEAWILILVVLLGLVFALGLAALVRHVAVGGESAGALGEFAFRLADIPAQAMAIATGKSRQRDFVEKHVTTARPRSQYATVAGVRGPTLDRLPIYWTSGATNLQPVAMMFRLNDAQDEHLLILDGARNVVRDFPVSAGSLSGRYAPLVGNSAPLMLDDGSIIVFSNGSDGLYRKDLCGHVIWSIPGLYNHSFSVADGKIGILGLPRADITDEDRGELTWNHSEIINIIDAASGKLERSVRLDEIARANAGRLDPFSWRLWQSKVNEHGVLKEDLIHLNKVEILPADMSAEYPGFPAGAWMISSRHFNLVAVVDPRTLEILWYSQGHTQGQHDPEFAGRGRVLVFNNGLSTNSPDPDSPLNFSSVRLLDFARQQWSEVYNARDVKGYSSHSGELDFTSDGTLMLNLTTQGRYLEVSPGGEVLSEFVNVRGADEVYWTKHAQYLSAKQLEIARSISCPQ